MKYELTYFCLWIKRLTLKMGYICILGLISPILAKTRNWHNIKTKRAILISRLLHLWILLKFVNIFRLGPYESGILLIGQIDINTILNICFIQKCIIELAYQLFTLYLKIKHIGFQCRLPPKNIGQIGKPTSWQYETSDLC